MQKWHGFYIQHPIHSHNANGYNEYHIDNENYHYWINGHYTIFDNKSKNATNNSLKHNPNISYEDHVINKFLHNPISKNKLHNTNPYKHNSYKYDIDNKL